jgi:hypothetical protein
VLVDAALEVGAAVVGAADACVTVVEAVVEVGDAEGWAAAASKC